MHRCTLIMLLLLSMHCDAQTAVRVVCSKTMTGLPGVTISYKDELSGKQLHAYTGDSGYAVLNHCRACTADIYSTLYHEQTGIRVSNNMVIVLEPVISIIKDVVVTGQHEQVSASKSVQRIRIIDAKTIEKRAAVNLKDLLTTELNIKISQDNILGSSMSMQGISGQNIKILQDGVPIIGRLDGNLDLSQINLSNVERVEIVEGPMSTIYGTDALGGVINLISKKHVKYSGATFSNYYETVGTVNTNLGLNLRHKSQTLRLEGGRNYFNGYSENEDPSLRWKQWKPKEQLSLNMNYSLRLKHVNLRYTGQFFHEKITARNFPVVTSTEAYAFDDYFKTKRLSNTISADASVGQRHKLSIISAFSTYERAKNRYRRDLLTIHDEITGPADQDTNRFTLAMSRAVMKSNIGKKLSLQNGYDINIETGKGGRMSGDRQQIQDYAIFSTLEWNLAKRMILKPGLRFIYNSRYGAPVIPSFNIKYFISKYWDIKGAYSKGFRAPSLKELSLLFVDINHNIRGNESLKAERSDNFNTGISYYRPGKLATTSFSTSIFYNSLKNVIDLALVDAQSQLYTYLNISSFKSLGITTETTVKYKGFNIAAGMSRTGRQNLNYKQYGLPQFNYSNEYNGSIGYYHQKYQAGINLFCKYNGSMPQYVYNSDGSTTQNRIKAYSMCDMSISKSFSKQRFVIYLGVKNLLNVHNINISSSGVHSSGSMPVGMGRFMFASLKINIENNETK